MFLLGIDTCGPSGSVALGRLTALNSAETIAQKELEGRTYSATLVTAIHLLLAEQGIGLSDIGCIVAINGPGSFTGVRVGLSAAKGLSEKVDRHQVRQRARVRWSIPGTVDRRARRAGVVPSSIAEINVTTVAR